MNWTRATRRVKGPAWPIAAEISCQHTSRNNRKDKIHTDDIVANLSMAHFGVDGSVADGPRSRLV